MAEFFAREIPAAIIRLRAFDHGVVHRTRNFRLLEDQFLENYLVYRALRDRRTRNNLSNRLHTILEGLIDYRQCTEAQLTDYLRKLVKAVIYRSRALWTDGRHFVTIPGQGRHYRTRLRPDTLEYDRVHAAALLGLSDHYDAVVEAYFRHRPPEAKHIVRAGEVLFGNVLAYAALGGNLDLILRIVNRYMYRMGPVEFVYVANFAIHGRHQGVIDHLFSMPVSRRLNIEQLWLRTPYRSYASLFTTFRTYCPDRTVNVERRTQVFHEAAKQGDVDFFREYLYIISSDPSISFQHPYGSVVATAAFFGQAGVLQYLLSRRRHFANWALYQHQHPLYHAAGGGYLDAVKVLMQHGATLDNDEYYSPLVAAAASGHVRVVEHFLRSGLDLDNHHRLAAEVAMCTACQAGEVRVVELMLEHGVDADCRRGAPALYAAWQPDVLDVLRRHGATNPAQTRPERLRYLENSDRSLKTLKVAWRHYLNNSSF